MGNLRGSLSHELRNSLSVMKNAVYCIKARGANIDYRQINEYLDVLSHQIDISTKLVNDALDTKKHAAIRKPKLKKKR